MHNVNAFYFAFKCTALKWLREHTVNDKHGTDINLVIFGVALGWTCHTLWRRSHTWKPYVACLGNIYFAICLFEWCFTPPFQSAFQLYHGVSRAIKLYYRYDLSCHRCIRYYAIPANREAIMKSSSKYMLNRGPDKEGFNSSFPHNISLIIQPNHMLWVLKRIVSMRRFFWVPTT